jgi:hypothetical protein
MYDMIENGVQGIQVEEPEENSDEDFARYGIDWDGIDNPCTMQHHLANNNNDEAEATVVITPQQLSHVEVPDPHCPFMTDHIEFLCIHIACCGLRPSFLLLTCCMVE